VREQIAAVSVDRRGDGIQVDRPSNGVAPSTFSPLRAMTMKRPQTTGNWRRRKPRNSRRHIEAGRCEARGFGEAGLDQPEQKMSSCRNEYLAYRSTGWRPGRIFSIGVVCTNASQLSASGSVTVSVPHDGH
jgi:hypothetical protein